MAVPKYPEAWTITAMTCLRALSKPLLAGLPLLMGATLSACSAAPVSDPEPAPPEVVEASVVAEPEILYRNIPADTLYQLLVAEFVGLDSDINTALAIYVEQARKTRDPGVIERAVRIAGFVNRQDTVLELAELWVEVEPENLDVRRLVAFQLARTGNVIEAFPHGEYLLLAGEGEYLQSLAAFAGDAGEAEKRRLLTLYEELAASHPGSAELLVGEAMLLRQLARNDDSLATVRKAIKLAPGNETAQLLLAQLLHQRGDTREALRALEKALAAEPASKRLRLQYARLLSEQNIEASRQQIVMLTEQYPGDADLLFSLALVDIELGYSDEARDALYSLVERRQRVDDAHFQLGRLAEQQGDLAAAIDHYRKVERGEHLLTAVVRLTDILVAQDNLESARGFLASLRERQPALRDSLYQLEMEILLRQGRDNEAHALLDQALEAQPDNVNLLYSRSVISAQREDLAATERDLRAILAQSPDNAAALNALGYSLTNLSTRYDEARVLIEQALALDPDNPAIIDSLAWVHYRLGNLDLALDYARQAYEAFPDPEVAAHYGEILWVRGEQGRARDIWRQSLQASSGDATLRATVERLTGEPVERLLADNGGQSR